MEMNFESQLQKLIIQSDEPMGKKYQYVLEQLKSENIENNLSEIGEDENDVDVLDEGVGEEEPNEVPAIANYPKRGDEVLAEFVIDGD